MNDFLKRQFVNQYKTQPSSALLDAPVRTLKGIQQRDVLLAQKHQINNIGDLIKQWPDLPITIDPSVIEAILAYLRPPEYDQGPSRRWELLFKMAPLDYYITHPSQRFRTEFGPVFYRGRLDGTARVLIVGQDPATDELIAQRILVGDAGQKLQKLLSKFGLTRSYVMFNSFLFGIIGQVDQPMKNILIEPDILTYRNKLFDQVALENKLEAIFAFGAAAHISITKWPGHVNYQNKVVEFVHPSANSAPPDWNAKFETAQALVTPDSNGQVDTMTPHYGQSFSNADSVAIPRYDLPFGIPAWHGTEGRTHSRRHDISKCKAGQNATEIVWDRYPEP